MDITTVVSHLINKKMFLESDPCRNKYALYKQTNKKTHESVALDVGVFYINTHKERQMIFFLYRNYVYNNTLEKGVHLSKTVQQSK